jgi:hypothetical protein
MTNHLTDEQLLAILHGGLAGAARDQAKTHLASCAQCAQALGRDAALDEVLWAAHAAQRASVEAAAPVTAAVAPSAALAAPSAAVAVRSAAARISAPAKGERPRRRRGLRWVLGATFGAAAMALLALAGNSSGAPASTEVLGAGALFAWQSVIFYIPLAIGILLVIGWSLGALHHHDVGAGFDGDHDVGHDAGHGHDADGARDGGGGSDIVRDHDGDGLVAKALAVLGVGRVPLTVVMMIVSLYFGGIGLMANTVLSRLGLPPLIYGPISIAIALVGTIMLAGSTARLLGRLLPTTETYLVSRHGFAGCTGKLLLPADTTSGYAQVKDREGNVHNIKCRTTGAALAKGSEILVVEYDEETKTYVVDANPVSGASSG